MGDTATPESVGITRSEGWDSVYSQSRSSGGKAPERTVMNRLLLELTTALVAFRDHGVLEYDDEVTYSHPAVVFGSDGFLYQSLPGNPFSGIDPAGSQGHTKWVRLLVPDVSGRLLDVRVMTASGQYQAPVNARRFEAIVTGGGQGGHANNAGNAGGTAFGWWTEPSRVTFNVTIGSGGGTNPATLGGASHIRVGNSYRLRAWGGGHSNNVNSSASNSDYGSGNLFHSRGGYASELVLQNTNVGGSSFWGSEGVLGAGGGESATAGGGQPGIVLIRSYS